MRALSIWQPMAWAIAVGKKPVENRSWPLPKHMLMERIAVHASKTYDEKWARAVRTYLDIEVPGARDVALGAVVAVTTLVGCIDDRAFEDLHEDDLAHLGMAKKIGAVRQFYSGPHGFLLAHTIALPEPVFCRGAQGFWTLKPEDEALVRAQLPPPPPP